MTHATTTTFATHATAMGNSNKKFVSHSFSATDFSNHSLKSLNKDVSKWSSTDVQNWIKKECKKYELKKSTVEKFQMNGKKNISNNNHIYDYHLFRSSSYVTK